MTTCFLMRFFSAGFIAFVCVGCGLLGEDERVLVVYDVQSGAVEYKQEFVDGSACRKIADNPQVMSESGLKMSVWSINGTTYSKIKMPNDPGSGLNGEVMGHGVKCVSGSG